MSAQLSMFDLTISEASVSVISSPALEDGRTRSDSPTGLISVLSGPAVAPASPSRVRGKVTAKPDPRHLWPAWIRLIRECHPAVIFGEQVASAAGSGWLDAVCADLEGEDYACGAVVLGAHSVGAPHIRQRLWFVAESECDRRRSQQGWRSGTLQGQQESEWPAQQLDRCSADAHRLADHDEAGCREQWEPGLSRLGHASCGHDLDGCGADGDMGHADSIGRQTLRVAGASGEAISAHQGQAIGAGNGLLPWADCIWLPCRDGKWRPTQSGLQPLAHGVSTRVGRLRGYGNAIVPQVAAEFIRAYLDVRAVA